MANKKKADVFCIKGKMKFILDINNSLRIETIQMDDEINIFPEELRDIIKKNLYQQKIYELIKGEKFIKLIESGFITDDDGTLTNIYVDGFDSNLGLCSKRFSQGKFLVTKNVFLDICRKHEVLVNWANK